MPYTGGEDMVAREEPCRERAAGGDRESALGTDPYEQHGGVGMHMPHGTWDWV